MTIYGSKYSESIVFIEEDENGEVWTNQVNGCACFHPEETGFVNVLVEHNDFSRNWFNPHFWYKLWHRNNGLIHEDHIKNISYKGVKADSLVDFYRTYRPLESEPKWKGSFSNYHLKQRRWRMENDPIYSGFYSNLDKLEEKIKSSEHFFSYEKLNKEIELALNEIKTPGMEFIKIRNPFPESMEAWVYVEVAYKNGNKKNGVITWENCD